MRTVPRQEILHAVEAGIAQMERILSRLCGQCLPADASRRERNGRIRDVQKREEFEYGEASLGGFWITRACLGQYDLGGEEIVVYPLLVPPRHGELLMGRHKQIPARSCGQITDNARFDIGSGSGSGRVQSFHGLKLLEKSGCVWRMIRDFGIFRQNAKVVDSLLSSTLRIAGMRRNERARERAPQ